MLRRSHRKSRSGCIECKKRHIKCDEHRPVCVNCSTAGIKCSFGSPTSHTKSQTRDGARNITPPGTASSSWNTTPGPVPETDVGVALPYVNTTHLELFYSAMSGRTWAFGDEDQLAAQAVVLEHALKEPFLLHEILAVSALHLSTQSSAKKYMHREEAVRLQSEAFRLFRASVVDLNGHNIIPAFIFSGLQGIATFFETFHHPTRKSNLSTNTWTSLEKVIQSLKILQGVQTIIRGWWDYLKISEIKGILKEDIMIPNLNWEDANTAKLLAFRAYIKNSPGMDQSQAAVYDTAIDDLILVYKTAFWNGEPKFHDQAATKYIIRWFVKATPAYTELLTQRRPQALLILGHVAVILHKLRGCWVAGEAAWVLLAVVESHLDETWQMVLTWPKSFVRDE